MFSAFELFWSPWRPIVVIVVAMGAAGCSSDSTRFGDLFGPKTTTDYTGSAPPAPAAPAGLVQESQLAPPSQNLPAPPVIKQTVTYDPAPYSRTVISQQGTGSTPTLSHEASRVKPLRPSAPLGRPAPAAPVSSTVHVVRPGDTLSKVAHRYHRSVADLARANNIAPHASLKIGERLTIPGVNAPARASVPVQRAPVASTTPPPGANVLSAVPEAPVAAPKPASEGIASLRWPVKGHIIAGFGPKTNGQQNDGINLAVPEGTPVKAAEDGVVAYAGNELKGYGNLVLVRHPNGYVTAYAHAKELMVKRGDEVKRGQIIAKSGQTGNVDAPQLHFEVRKGQTPVDPIPLLTGG
ncbi:MAG TPA: M23 family metallopeptidase [Xanthobacteraceae bacterium]|jgi:LysM repeat protein